ncbi:hypothetical protein GUITHDRAFT_58399, partial [Guillardia theta CCMP2712]
VASYIALFHQHDSDHDGFISGQQARPILAESGLPVQELRRIWDLSDLTKDGMLDAREFAVAMHLIEIRKKDGVLPTSLPQQLL